MDAVRHRHVWNSVCLRWTMMCASIALVVVMLSGGMVDAQEATPVPDVPDPAECTVAPRTIDNLIAIVGEAPPATPGADEGDDDEDDESEDEEDESNPFAIPTGTPADQQTVDALNALLRMGRACLNAGDFPRFLALFTDEYIAANLGPIGDEERAFLTAAAEPVPVGEREGFTPLQDVIVLADGRVGALIPEPDADDYAIFKLVDGVWLIDEDIPDIDPIVATPTN